MSKHPLVTMMLAWFDEPEELLHQAVTSSAVIADRIVAADGAYDLVTDKAPTSPPAQRKAISEAAKEAGIELEFLKPRLWDGQVQKRNALLDAATADLKPSVGRAFVMPLDADWLLTGDKEAIRAELERDYVEQFYVRFHQPSNPDVDARTAAPHEWHRKYDGKTNWEPLLFRALYKMRLEKTHWHYSGERLNGKRVGLSGGVKLGYFRPIEKRLNAEFEIEHRCMFRDSKRLERNRDFCAARDRERELVGYEA